MHRSDERWGRGKFSRRRAISNSITLGVSLDVHKDSTDIAKADAGLDGEIRRAASAAGRWARLDL